MNSVTKAFSIRAIPLRWLIMLMSMPVLMIPLFGAVGLISWIDEAEQRLQLLLQRQAYKSASLLQEDPSIIALLQQSPLPSIHLQSIPIEVAIELDGRIDDWPEHKSRTFGLEQLLETNASYSVDSLSYELSVGASERYLYLFYQVVDDRVVYRQFNNPSVHRNDHIRIGTINDDGKFTRYTIANFQPGETVTHVIAGNGRALRETEKVNGMWRATEAGYNVEIQMPRDLLSERFSTTLVDVDDPDKRSIQFIMGLAETTSAVALGWLGFPDLKLRQLVDALPVSGLRLTDTNGRLILGESDDRYASNKPNIDSRILSFLDYRNFRAVAPLVYQGKEIGLVSLDGDNTEVITLAKYFLQRSAVIVGFLFIITIVLGVLVAKIIDLRLNKLQVQFDSVITSPGRIIDRLPMNSGRDSISKLSRGLGSMIDRVGQYNDYLEQMAGRLSHELRTPISVVRSSLDNLNQTGLSNHQLVYVERAFGGIDRLSNILGKMSEARRLEEGLDETEVIVFDLAALVRGCIQGYESAYEDQSFQLNIESEKIKITGIPDLIAQLLDKLISNAVAFSESDQPIIVRLTSDDDEAVLRVINAGVELPAEMESELFDSLVSVRGAATDDDSHLGLGLYVSRIITEFHGGTIRAANREDVKGVIVTVVLPIMRITTKLL